MAFRLINKNLDFSYLKPYPKVERKDPSVNDKGWDKVGDFLFTKEGSRLCSNLLCHVKEKVTKYLFVRLCIGNMAKNFFVHKLVATAFCVKSNNHTEINHIDENPANNRADNLEWCTHSQNINHRNRNRKVAENIPNRKEVDQYTKDGEFIKRHFSISDAARDTGIDVSHISMCCRRLVRCAHGFLFCYAGEFNPKPIAAKKTLPEERKVIQLTTNGEFLAKFDTLSDAAKYTNSNPNNIRNVMNGLRRTCNGFCWMRNSDYIVSKLNRREDV